MDLVSLGQAMQIQKKKQKQKETPQTTHWLQYIEITMKLQQTVYLILGDVLEGKHFLNTLTNQSLQEVREENLSVFTDTRGRTGESTSTRAYALNLGARDSLSGLIKRQKPTLKLTPRWQCWKMSAMTMKRNWLLRCSRYRSLRQPKQPSSPQGFISNSCEQANEQVIQSL